MLQKDLFSIQFIDIVSVESSLPLSHYSVNEIEALATNYLECGGNINPIIVERIGLDEYRVIEGNLELYAAQKAKEKDKFFEMIRAIILDKNNEKFVHEQVDLLKQTHTPSPPKLDTEVRLENSIAAETDSLSGLKIIQRLEDLENSLLAKFKELTIKLDALPQQRIETPPDRGEKQSLDKMSVPELKTEAKKRGFSGYSRLKKAELVALLG